MKLSVCIPVYNVAPYVERCARSLFAQTYRDMEFIFVDDCSPDDSVAIVQRVLKEYPLRQPQVKFVRHECNRGLIAARKTAVLAATGDLIAHCDSDDWLDEDLYETMIRKLQETDSDMAICAIDCNLLCGRQSWTFSDSTCISGQDVILKLDSVSSLNSMVNKIMRREIVNLDGLEWPETISIAEDFCCMMQLLVRARRVVGVSGPLYHYRINSNSMTRSRNLKRLVADHMTVFDILSRRLPVTCATPVLRYLARMVLFWGVVAGRLNGPAYRLWRKRLIDFGGNMDFTDRSLWGQRMMKIAGVCLPVSRIVSPFVKNMVSDIL